MGIGFLVLAPACPASGSSIGALCSYPQIACPKWAAALFHQVTWAGRVLGHRWFAGRGVMRRGDRGRIGTSDPLYCGIDAHALCAVPAGPESAARFPGVCQFGGNADICDPLTKRGIKTTATCRPASAFREKAKKASLTTTW